MADAIMDSVLGMLPPETKQSLATRLGEATPSVETGLAAACAAILDELASKADTGGFRAQVLTCVSAAVDHHVDSDIRVIGTADPTGPVADLLDRFLPMVFGSQQGEVAYGLARQCRVSAASAMGLLKIAAGLLLAFFGKVQSAGGLDAATLTGLLQDAAPDQRNYPPGALHGSAAGFARAIPTRPAVPNNVAHAPAPPRWLVPISMAGALLLGWLAFRSFTAPKEAATVATVTAEATNSAVTAAGKAASDAATAAWEVLGDLMKVTLPDGSVLDVPALGVEARLVQFLEDGAAGVSDSSWFDFDRLLFDSGKATLQLVSEEQLSNIAAILKAYPEVTVRIAGYSDDSGDPRADLRLSEERADNVMDELVRLGIDPARMNARGYGRAHPVADNSTEEGRQRNRRISLRVTDRQTAV